MSEVPLKTLTALTFDSAPSGLDCRPLVFCSIYSNWTRRHCGWMPTPLNRARNHNRAHSRLNALAGSVDVAGLLLLQGYLAHKKQHPRTTLPQDHA